jgi:pimeloyl-ACP methyl ester carboxylesterase
VSLFVEHWGAGPPVVFLHGLGASARYWQQLRDASTGYAGIAPDLLGFGRSPAPPGAAYDIDDHLTALEPRVPAGALLVGHSTGALLAVALAARHPDLARSLLLMGMPAYSDEADARAEVGRLGLLARLTVRGNPMARLMCGAMCRLRPLAIAAAPFVIRDLPPSIAADGARHTWPSYHGTLEHVVVRYRPVSDLTASRAPITFLHGTSDRTAPPAAVSRLVDVLAARGRSAHLRLVPGDHQLAVRHPATVAAVLAELLQTTEVVT